MIADQYLQLRTELETALTDLLKLSGDLRRDAASLDTLHGLLKDVREPLLFVAVGEVKAGKSSLLNALFGQEFAKVDVLPATDRVYIFRYGEEEKSVEISPELIERYLPIPFLRDFSVVDTPGTNTMVPAHQTITESFIPRADLILFVFSVVNPWSQSAWDLLSFVKQKWLKNIVFVLQQADLRETSEVEIIHRHLRDTALQKLGDVPPIFAVSARKALLARTTGLDKQRLWNESQFGPLEDQINRMVTESGTGIMKLRSTAKSAGVILNEIDDQIRGSFDQILRDEDQLTRVDSFLNARKEQTLRQVVGFLRGIEQACFECTRQGIQMLEQKLSFWRTWRLIWSREQWQREFQIEVEAKLRQTVQPQIEKAVEMLETDLRALWPQLQEIIEDRFKSNNNRMYKTIPDFARERGALVNAMQLTLVERIAGKAVEQQLGRMFRETANWLRLPAGVAAAGGLITIIVAMSSAAAADVTGVLAASAAIIGSVVALTQRKKILNAYRAEMEIKRQELVHAIEEQMTHAIALFYQETALAFAPLTAFCASERKRCGPLKERADKMREKLRGVTTRLGE
jgi:tRNA U34 5-carboxymethylaminomethyl modifying GTPase MnmE/TrmE